jgi:hypothetical protein
VASSHDWPALPSVVHWQAPFVHSKKDSQLLELLPPELLPPALLPPVPLSPQPSGPAKTASVNPRTANTESFIPFSFLGRAVRFAQPETHEAAGSYSLWCTL